MTVPSHSAHDGRSCLKSLLVVDGRKEGKDRRNVSGMLDDVGDGAQSMCDGRWVVVVMMSLVCSRASAIEELDNLKLV